MTPCSKKIINELCDYLGYDLDGNMCKELHAHIQVCEKCRDYVESVKQTVTICKSATRKAVVPEDVKQDLINRLKKRHKSEE